MDNIIRLRMTNKEIENYKENLNNSNSNIFNFCNIKNIELFLCECTLLYELELTENDHEDFIQKIIIPKDLYFSLSWKKIKKWIKEYFENIIFEFSENELKNDFSFNIDFCIDNGTKKIMQCKIISCETQYYNLSESNNWFFKNFAIFNFKENQNFEIYFNKKIHEIEKILFSRITSKTINEDFKVIKKFVYFRERIIKLIGEYNHLHYYFKTMLNENCLYKPIYKYHGYPTKEDVLNVFAYEQNNYANKIIVTDVYEKAVKQGKDMLFDDDTYDILTILPLNDGKVKIYLMGSEINISEYTINDFIIK